MVMLIPTVQLCTLMSALRLVHTHPPSSCRTLRVKIGAAQGANQNAHTESLASIPVLHTAESSSPSAVHSCTFSCSMSLATLSAHLASCCSSWQALRMAVAEQCAACSAACPEALRTYPRCRERLEVLRHLATRLKQVGYHERYFAVRGLFLAPSHISSPAAVFALQDDKKGQECGQVFGCCAVTVSRPARIQNIAAMPV